MDDYSGFAAWRRENSGTLADYQNHLRTRGTPAGQETSAADRALAGLRELLAWAADEFPRLEVPAVALRSRLAEMLADGPIDDAGTPPPGLQVLDGIDVRAIEDPPVTFGSPVMTVDELAAALRTVRLWFRTEGSPDEAYRGTVLHPVTDAAPDIMTAVEHARQAGPEPENLISALAAEGDREEAEQARWRDLAGPGGHQMRVSVLVIAGQQAYVWSCSCDSGGSGDLFPGATLADARVFARRDHPGGNLPRPAGQVDSSFTLPADRLGRAEKFDYDPCPACLSPAGSPGLVPGATGMPVSCTDEFHHALASAVYLYKTNSDLVCAQLGDGPVWEFGPVTPDMYGDFTVMAAAWASGVWEPGEDAGQQQAGPPAGDPFAGLDLVATWFPGDGLEVPAGLEFPAGDTPAALGGAAWRWVHGAEGG